MPLKSLGCKRCGASGLRCDDLAILHATIASGATNSVAVFQPTRGNYHACRSSGKHRSKHEECPDCSGTGYTN